MGDVLTSFLGQPSRAETDLGKFSKAGFSNKQIQKFLPSPLERKNVNPILQAGIQAIGELIQNPGQLSPTVSESILPRLATTSEGIARDFRGIRSQQAGRLARTNAPVSIRNALDQALDVSQSRAQRGSRREALTESEGLRRQDVGQVFNILNALLQFTSAGRGTAVQGLGQQAGIAQQRQQANQAFLGDIIESVVGGITASASRFKKDFESVSSDELLAGIRSLPVYEWSYKGDGRRHVGPMAEDFRKTFGLGGSPDYIHIIDAIGTMMAATQSLARKVEKLESPN